MCTHHDVDLQTEKKDAKNEREDFLLVNIMYNERK
jgi:hypothetical protein